MKLPPFAFTAAFGFLLSLIAGIIGGVGFGEGILRGILVAVVFGGATFGLQIVFNRFFPELFEETPADIPTEERGGGRFDMTVGETEMPFSADSDPSEDGFSREMGEPSHPKTEVPTEDIPDMDEFSSQNDLPDMPSMSDSYHGGGDRRNFSDLGSMDSKDNVLLEGMDEDPTILAKAVQSVLKKDND